MQLTLSMFLGLSSRIFSTSKSTPTTCSGRRSFAICIERMASHAEFKRMVHCSPILTCRKAEVTEAQASVLAGRVGLPTSAGR